ncbi:MAG: Ldh family oxidoreductase [Planctomycetes bacterium]|nr:Ldh family oxidoreductase [Planctomycetota bacterium]
MQVVAYGDLVDFGSALLVARGVDAEKARDVAEPCVLAEACGIRTHGLGVLAAAVEAVAAGRVDPRGEPKVIHGRGATAMIDGQKCFGQLAMKLAKTVAVRKAHACGVAAVGVKLTGWVGALGPYLLDLVEQGLAAQLVCQAAGCRNCPPAGGREPLFSTNPIALGLPAGGEPIIADFSSASISLGKARRMATEGRLAPEPIFLDAAGRPGRDPAVVDSGGCILPTGGLNFGYKGFALCLWAEAMAALAGGPANVPGAPSCQNLMLTVIDPDALAGREHFLEQMRLLVEAIAAAPVRDEGERIRLPGRRALAALRKARSDGIPVEARQIERLNALAEQAGLSSRL